MNFEFLQLHWERPGLDMVSTAGSWTCIVPVEQWPYKEFDHTELYGDTAYNLPSFGEERKESLEPSCAKPDTECEKDILRSRPGATWWMLGQISRGWSQGKGDTGEAGINLEAFGRFGSLQGCKQRGCACFEVCFFCCHFYQHKSSNYCRCLMAAAWANCENLPCKS